jgi:hypothetical protein
MRHIGVRGKEVRNTTQMFNSITYKYRNIIQSYKHHFDTCMFKNEWSLYELKRVCYADSYMKEGVRNFDLYVMNVSREYGIINFQLIFTQPILDKKSYFGNIDDILEILGYIPISEINTRTLSKNSMYTI